EDEEQEEQQPRRTAGSHGQRPSSSTRDRRSLPGGQNACTDEGPEQRRPSIVPRARRAKMARGRTPIPTPARVPRAPPARPARAPRAKPGRAAAPSNRAASPSPRYPPASLPRRPRGSQEPGRGFRRLRALGPGQRRLVTYRLNTLLTSPIDQERHLLSGHRSV